MNIVQLIIFTLVVYPTFAASSYDNESWKNLLHNKEIISPDWYLSNEKTPKAEFEQFEKELRSSSGGRLVCEFPARFYYFKEILKQETLHNLNNCSELNEFYQQFNKNRISLALTSEYYNAPSSAFGHIMLVFHNDSTPELDSIAVHFSALTRQDDFIHYSANGLSGNYYGYFFQEPFFKKYNEYSNIEQRYLFIHELKLTDIERKFLIYHLFELKKARFKYYFLAKNCGYQIDKLLQTTFNETNDSASVYLLPVEVLKKNESHLARGITIPPLSIRTQNSIKKLSNNDNQLFRQIVNDQEIKEKIDNDLSNDLKKSLFLYSQYQFRKKKNILPRYDDIQKLKVENINAVDLKDKESEQVSSPLKRVSSRRLTQKSAYLNHDHSLSYFLAFRPVLVDLNDFQNHNLHESTFNLMNTEINYNHSTLKLEKLDIVDLKLISPSKEFFHEPSWFFTSGLNRNNYLNANSFSNSLGIGQSFDLKFSFSYFLGTSFDYIEFDKFKVAFYGIYDIVHYFNDQNKLLLEGKYKAYRNRNFYKHDFTFIRSLGSVNLSLGYEYSKNPNEFFRFDYYF